MRLGIVLDSGAPKAAIDDARHAEAAGLDLCWVPQSFDGAGSGAVVAAAIAAATQTLRLVVECSVDEHPIEVAEELIVTDLIANGRVLAAVSGAGAGTEEFLQVLEPALGGKLFAHTGERWTLPRPDSSVEHILVTPASPQIEMPIWLTGLAHAELAFRHGLPFVAESTATGDAIAACWSECAEVSGPLAARLPRVAVRRIRGEKAGVFDASAIVAMLKAERTTWRLDSCLVDLHADSVEERRAGIDMLGHRVRPQLQTADLVEELVDSWDLVDDDQEEKGEE